MYENEIQRLLQKLAFTDDVTYYHSLRVGCLLAQFTETEDGKKFVMQAWVTQKECITAGLLHEVSKTSWPRELLFSAERLPEMERDTLLKFWSYRIQHPLLAADMILDYYNETGNRFWERIAKGVAAHHEDYDGGGYPLGLRGTEIPLLARGLRLFDSYAAMVEFRRFRKVLEPETVLKEMGDSLGCHYDPYWGRKIIDFLAEQKPCPDLDNWLETFIGEE